MIKWIRARHNWLIPIVVGVLALTIGVATRGAIASSEAAPDHCAQLYAPATSDYERCRFWDDPSLEGSIAGQAPAATSYADPQPVVFCAAETPPVQKTNGKTMISATSCAHPITCEWRASTGKYHCTNSSGASVNPPGRVCAENSNYACGATASQAPADPSVLIAPTTQTRPTDAQVPSQSAAPTPTSSVGTPSVDTLSPAVNLPTPTPGIPDPTATPTPTPSATATADPSDPTAQALQHAKALGLRIWLETDLVAAWQAGPAQLQAAAARLAQHAAAANVVGVKVAAELGLRGGFDNTAAGAEQIRTFLSDVSKVMRATLPPGRQIAVDVIVPELGCGQSQACVTAMRTGYPLLTLAEVETYVLTGNVDAVNLSSPLVKPFVDVYTKAGISQDRVLQQQWLALRQRNWDSKVPGLYIGARDIGLAHSGTTSTLTGAVAENAVKARVDQPLKTGVRHVVLWTWRQTWNDTDWRLTNRGDGQGLKSSGVWDALRTRKPLERTSVIFNPREFELSIAEDLKEIATVASTVYITAQ
ncbi:hypothetical protein OG339_48210 (plasmid) [Streptosporangium sp. NBC_01495]|uniref:hypothetical protein n=1 Tax=Streptosporangium sp. NBC_01495 TaxID=2903899 RepID=UPI002E32A43B|nr:hypothetical protein [Streptosporangium sp. NBC_01495]